MLQSPKTVSIPEPRIDRRAKAQVGGGTRAMARSPTPAGLGSILAVGTSFKTATLKLREGISEALSDVSAAPNLLAAVDESTTLQTCNRLELYLVSSRPKETQKDLFSRLPPGLMERREAFYVLSGADAISHLFALASGLESMVLGEEQIISQIRDARGRARLEGRSKAVLSILFDVAAGVGGRVRTSAPSHIRPQDRSVSTFALRFALEKLPQRPRRVLLIGTGSTMRLAARELQGCEVFIATRRPDAAPRFLRTEMMISQDDVAKVAQECDLIISATTHEGHVLEKGQLPDDTPRILIDLAFPRNIDPRLKDSRQIKLYDLDDLAAYAAATPSNHDAEFVRHAGAAVERETTRFVKRLTASRLSPTIGGFYRWAETLRAHEAEAAIQRLPGLTPREKRIVEAMSRRLVSKLLAPAARFGRDSTTGLTQRKRLELLNEVFGAVGGGEGP